MGVPAFFRWLSERYPKIMLDVVEEEPEQIGTVEVPVDITQPNPNGVEFDNLYLDMNGIIHPCFHPEDKPAPKTEVEVFTNIFEYIDRLVAMVRPRKIVYMAIDGVAPRAKMNQQRSRRFRAAADREEQKETEAKLRAEFKAQGIIVPPAADDGDTFDSNVITPGTGFMERLSMVLQWYVHKRLNEHSGWRDISVILSDANTPGEGEHKFMQFIREQRGRPAWNANTVHCVYGLDADLIHLALASHEPHFYILREVVFPPKRGGAADSHRSNLSRMMADGKNGGVGGQRGGGEAEKKPQVAKKPFQLMRIAVLREYLGLEFSDMQIPFALDLENLVDDFVFICFFVGNDFLPHMPTLDIREQGIELMMTVYKATLGSLGGYLSNGADLDLDRVGRFIQAVGQYEDKIFQARMRKMRSDKNRHLAQKAEAAEQLNGGASAGREGAGGTRGGNGALAPEPAQLNSTDPKTFLSGAVSTQDAQYGGSNKGAASKVRQALTARLKGAGASAQQAGGGAQAQKRIQDSEADGAEPPRKMPCPPTGASPEDADGRNGAVASGNGGSDVVMQMWDDLGNQPHAAEGDTKNEDASAAAAPASEDDAAAYKDKLKGILKSKSDMFEDMVEHEEVIRLGDAGWKTRYYQQKFGIEAGPEQQELIKNLVKSYVEGLCWVMKYYFDGVASWTWFYPFHYAPFASDLVDIAHVEINFSLGQPFTPFNQLMGVLPAGSKHALPEALQPLFDDENSPILDFYPKDFKVDINGKRFAWQGVALLPFIDEDRLLEATTPIIDALPEEERQRNQTRLSVLLARRDSPAGNMIMHQASFGNTQRLTLQAQQLGYSGEITPCAGSPCPDVFPKPPCAAVGPDIFSNAVAMALYQDPDHQQHIPTIMPGTELPEPILGAVDRPRDQTLWCERGIRNRDGGPPREGGPGRGHYATVGRAGHRMVNHYVQRPPPAYTGHPQRPPPMRPNAPPFQPSVRPPSHLQQPVMYPGASQQYHGNYVVVQPPGPGHLGMQYGMQPGIQAQPMYVATPSGGQGHGGSFFAAMRPPPAQGPGPVSYQHSQGTGWNRGGHGGRAGGVGRGGRRGGDGDPRGGRGQGYGNPYGNSFSALRDPRSRR